jgi:hypothetical protein
MAHEFSVALRARCALLLPHGVLPRIENPLPALRTREVTFRSHARKGTRRQPHSRLAVLPTVLVNAADGWSVAEWGVGPSSVVVAQE